MIVPISKMLIAARYNHLVEIRELSQALTGIIIPLTNINPVVNHCTVDVVMLKSFISVGKAVVKIVWLSTVQKVPINKTAMSKLRLYGLPCVSTVVDK